jgi:hypothetical protein
MVARTQGEEITMFLKTPYEEIPVPMERFDPTIHVKVLKQVLETIKEPHRRKILTNVIEHAAAEGDGRYEDLMATCSKRSQSYLSWGSGEQPRVNSYADLEVYYGSLIAAKVWMIHYDMDKVIVGDDAVMMDGVLHQLYPTELVPVAFKFELDPAYRAYQMTKRISVIFIFDEDGISCGEHAYANGPFVPQNFTPVEDQYLPSLFTAGGSDQLTTAGKQIFAMTG